MSKLRTFKNDNLLNLVPQHAAEYIYEDSGVITIRVERNKSVLMKRLAAMFRKSRYLKIHLDEKGTAVWEAIDGIRTVQEIGAGRSLNFRSDSPDRGHQEFLEFLSILYQNRFIELKRPDPLTEDGF